MPFLLGCPLIVYYLTLPRLNLSGWEVEDVWLVLTGPLLPLRFHTFAFKIQSGTWGSFLTKSLASPCTSTSSLAPATISSASCALCPALCPAALQPPSCMHLSQVGWTTVARSWRACLWLKPQTSRLDRVLRCAARLIGRIPKYGSVRFAGCLRLICIAVAGLGAPLSRFLEGAPYKFLNE